MVSILVVWGGLAFGQSLEDDDENENALTKEEWLNQLETLQAQLDLAQARAEMEQAERELKETQQLYDEKIVTVDRLNRASQAKDQADLAYKQAEIELDKTRLEFLKGATLVTVVDAKKFRGPAGQVMASVTLRNDSDIDKARVAMGKKMSQERLQALLTIDNVIVSLRDKAIIGDPYQQIVPEFKYGDEVTLEYRLLKREVDAVTITVEFLQEEKEFTVFLKKEAAQDLPTVASTQYAQEGRLGSKISYDLELERLASTEQSFSLVVLNLPRAIPFAFVDPESGARVTQLRFTEERSTQYLKLELPIPEKLDQELVDSNIDFAVVVTRPSQLVAIGELRQQYEGKTIPVEEIARIKGNRVGLKLIPTGVGKLDILVPNLFKEVKRGQPISLKFTLLNSGTLLLRNVTPQVDLPIEWIGSREPKSFAEIDPGEKTLVTAYLSPPEEVAIGDYTVNLSADGKSGIETIEAADKSFTVRIAAEANITGTIILVGILVALVFGIAIASIKISRR